MSSLLDLPPEIVLEIYSHLTDHDARTIRMVNKGLERICFDVFARKHFRKRGFMITTESIYTLTQIAHHADIRKHVHHLWFNPDCFTGVDCLCEPQDQNSRSTECCLIAAYQADHRSLLHTRSLEVRLRAVLRNLPRLKTIGMRRSAAYKPYGWRAMADRTEKDPRELGRDSFNARGSSIIETLASARTRDIYEALNRPFPWHANPMTSEQMCAPLDTTCLFMAILKALHGTHIHLERLYTDAIELDYPALDWPSTEELTSTLSSVKYFEINIIGIHRRMMRARDRRVHEFSGSGERLETLLKAMSGLHELGLTIFKEYDYQSRSIPPRPRSYSFLMSKRLVDTDSIHNLSRVKLEKLDATVPILIGLLQHSSAVLMSLKLSRIRLLREDGTETDEWTSFFGFLLEHCRSLMYVLLTNMQCDNRAVSFVQYGSGDNNGIQPELGHFFDVEIVGKEEIHKRLPTLRASSRHIHNEPSRERTHAGWYTDTSDEDW